MDQIKPEFLKKLTKFLVVSIWILSLLLTHNNFYLYSFTIQLVTHTVDKNYMFLLCNALLVFVASYSGSISSSSKPIESITDHKTFDYRDFESYNAILEVECYYSSHETGTDSEEVTVKSLEEDAKPEETEDIDRDQEEEFDLREEWINEGEEEENVVVMNKKFDEFIRKMKEELRIEAKRHLILV